MPDVPRETVTPPVPAEARGAFPADRLSLAEQYVGLLAGPGTERGLIGPRETPRLWDRHLLNCAGLATVIAPSASVCDVGSGAGLPGLVLAIARPDLSLTLVEPLLRRTTFLEEVVDRLGLSSVRVVRGRAEDLHGGAAFDVVTSRAVTALPRLLDWSMPLVRPDGALVAMKGISVFGEIGEARDALIAWGCAAPEVLRIAVGREPAVVDFREAGAIDGSPEPAPADGAAPGETTVVRVAWRDPSAVGWPPVRRRSSSSGSRRSRSAASGRRRTDRSPESPPRAAGRPPRSQRPQ